MLSNRSTIRSSSRRNQRNILLSLFHCLFTSIHFFSVSTFLSSRNVTYPSSFLFLHLTFPDFFFSFSTFVLVFYPTFFPLALSLSHSLWESLINNRCEHRTFYFVPKIRCSFICFSEQKYSHYTKTGKRFENSGMRTCYDILYPWQDFARLLRYL